MLGIHDVPVVGVAKGPDRNAGPRGLPLAGRPRADASAELARALLPPAAARRGPPLRDRRAPRRSAQGLITVSPLDEVPGIGPARKRALLMHFGTARAVKGAALEDLEKAPGISRAIARQGLYDYFHPAG